ncbi:pyridoxamine 5'-phosphate oxidase [Nocardioides albus]|uniref:Pyridoxine/pyridoxamine 5'-phosphate oxidase n=1 Tax=Nocardioides albus TaxID=1841 RepID=A0A7W5A1C7_9ACTN|nr:pyridoxamine 5'-phosphate oxidase [Nocardioides albus]MBB3087666.1 pyridoxamine 5'-phosphate oxidase [Nocardioides albus]GGU10600.1 pyridoxine/pyridoxamine 5'-phosphate oxidase [Nocardioides albus]
MDLAAELAAARENYTRSGLHEDDLEADPFTMFERWYAEARDAGIVEPNAMVVSTVSADGAPSSRTVLLKGFSTEGFTFFTNTASRKGSDLAANPRIAVLFPWHPLERQVRIDGLARELSRADVEAYFSQRPRGSQLGAHASHQSRVVSGREELAAAYERVEAQFDGQPVPVPEEWGGYRVEPERVEFWQGRPGRMHDRLVYLREGEKWRTERLAP